MNASKNYVDFFKNYLTFSSNEFSVTSNPFFKSPSINRNQFDESQIVDYSNYTEKYWDKRVMSPSCLIYYLGVDTKTDKLEHHNLFFDKDIDKHTEDIYINMEWPEDPLFYVCCPSKPDNSGTSSNDFSVNFPLVPNIIF